MIGDDDGWIVLSYEECGYRLYFVGVDNTENLEIVCCLEAHITYTGALAWRQIWRK